MKHNIKSYLFLSLLVVSFTACLKSNPYYEDFSSTQPIADLPKAPANALNAAAPTNSWFILDSVAGGVDYPTAVHISYREHLGDVTVRMKVDKAAGQAWIDAHPTSGFKLLPDSLYTVKSLDVVVPNAGVFSTGDFIVHIRTDVRDPATSNPTGKSIFKTNKFILPVTIESVPNTSYGIAANYASMLWYIRVK